MEPATRLALSFWPALNLPTANVPSRRCFERSQRQSSREKRLRTPTSSRYADEASPSSRGTGSANPAQTWTSSTACRWPMASETGP